MEQTSTLICPTDLPRPGLRHGAHVCAHRAARPLCVWHRRVTGHGETCKEALTHLWSESLLQRLIDLIQGMVSELFKIWQLPAPTASLPPLSAAGLTCYLHNCWLILKQHIMDPAAVFSSKYLHRTVIRLTPSTPKRPPAPLSLARWRRATLICCMHMPTHKPDRCLQRQSGRGPSTQRQDGGGACSHHRCSSARGGAGGGQRAGGRQRAGASVPQASAGMVTRSCSRLNQRWFQTAAGRVYTHGDAPP